MSLNAKDKGGEDFKPIPAGLHNAVCYAVIDIGTQPQLDPRFRAKQQSVFIWELPTERIEIEKDGVKKNLPRAISDFFTVSLSKKSNMRPMLESWRGKAFTEDELKGFNIGKVAGAGCQLNIVHERKNDKDRSVISAIVPLPKGLKLKAENPIVTFDLEEWLKLKIATLPDSIPEWINAKIMQSREWLDARGGGAPDDGHGGEHTVGEAEDGEEVPF